MIDAIKVAIRDHKQLVFEANGFHRVVCPHILGTKSGEWHMLAWQINDDSEKGFKPGEARWRCFELDDMTGLHVQAGEWVRGWTTGRGKQHCVDEIIATVDPAHAAEIQSTSR